jgi:dienelactone hydrolase
LRLLSGLLCPFSAALLVSPAGLQGQVLHYQEPSAAAFVRSSAVRYGTVDTTALLLDVYRPAGVSAIRPTLVFYTYGAQRGNPVYTDWARIVAAKGVIAILADLRTDAPAQDFSTLLAFLEMHGAEHGIDTAAIAVFGASSNAENLLPIAQDPSERRIKGLVMYYGSNDAVTTLRRDLPMLLVRTGLDRPFVNAGIDSLAARALRQNVPLAVINLPSGHHGFEYTDDNAISRDVVDQTVAFVQRVTGSAYRAALANGVTRSTAAAQIYAGDFGAAAATYAELVRRSPDDARLRLAYGVALLENRQYALACSEFDKLRGRGLGPRDLGLPAARACLQKGDPEASLAWLQSIPKQFLPARVADEAVFAPLRERAEFRALFQR